MRTRVCQRLRAVVGVVVAMHKTQKYGRSSGTETAQTMRSKYMLKVSVQAYFQINSLLRLPTDRPVRIKQIAHHKRC